LQRLFSTFANGLPGVGLMLQRLMTAAVLVHRAVMQLNAATLVGSAVPQMIDAGAGLLLLAGLWTPLAGSVVAGRELWAVFSDGGDPWMALVLATLGATLAMIGPGAWSVDARLFGRRQIMRLR
jgi:putative oxidoreductase